MATRVENIIFRIQTDLSDVQKDTKKVRQEVQKTGKSVESLRTGFSNFAATIGVAFSVGALITFGKELFKISKELETTAAKAKTVFGASLKFVQEQAEKTAKSLGITTNEYIKLATAAGDLLIPLGFTRKEAARLSTEVTGLSGAMSEWTGGVISSKDANTILTKAILGERDALVSLGIKISEADVKQKLIERGTDKATGTLLKQERALATIELLYANTADAQQSFIDNSDTLVRQQAELNAELKNLAETLAIKLTPAFSDILGLTLELVEGFPNVISGVKSGIEDILPVIERLGNVARLIIPGFNAIFQLRDQIAAGSNNGLLAFVTAEPIEKELSAFEKALADLSKLRREQARQKAAEDAAAFKAKEKADAAATKAQIAADKAATKLADELRKQEEAADERQHDAIIKRLQADLDLKKEFLDKERAELKKFNDDILSDYEVFSRKADAENAKFFQSIIDNQEKEKEAIKDFALAAIDIFASISDARIKDLDRAVDAQENRLNRALEITKDFNDATVVAEQERLDALLEEREKAVERQRALDALQFAATSALALVKALETGGVVGFFAAAALLLGIGAQVASISSSAGFAEGGYTGDGGKLDVAGTVHKGEFVFDQQKTKKHKPLFEAIHTGKPMNWDMMSSLLSVQGQNETDKEMNSSLKKIEKAILGQESMYVKFDAKGIRILTKRFESKESKIRRYAN